MDPRNALADTLEKLERLIKAGRLSSLGYGPDGRFTIVLVGVEHLEYHGETLADALEEVTE